ncbi:hypothetical protein SAMN05192549_104448 [Duganella sacchari]|uniref:Pyridine nucleotide-disulphide oxidoreductase n=1 Tax=Duganella sacchari TaxID=551987 RepID=A0A1M7P6Y8_9BURK|nr:hypothetical protein [Duganella sacchari]SHN12147.1 hypothetical protein SAMN05192549_104448 [Duganella sacchari]
MMHTLGALIVGAGPAGIGLLLAARSNRRLAELLNAGLAILDNSPRIGAGELGRYAIRSDSFADSFLTSATADAEPPLTQLLEHGPGALLNRQRGGPVALQTVAEFMTDLGGNLRRWLMANHYDPFIGGVSAIKASQQKAGDWLTEYHDTSGAVHAIRSRSLILATGATQSLPHLEHATVAGKALLPRFADKTVLSGDLLSHGGTALLSQRLAGIKRPRIAVVGGSHSAMSSALVCLRHWDTQNIGDGKVSVLHRRPFRITYQTPDVAIAEGYRDFGPDDICPRSGRVYPLAGMRSDARHLVRQYWHLGDATPEPRLQLLQLNRSNQHDADTLLQEADLIVAALGYRPRALPLFSADGQPFALHSDKQGAAMVDGRSRVLDAAAQPIAGVYGLGLSSGYPMAGTYGEPSFQGESNGLSLWHGEIGAAIVSQVLEHVHSNQLGG